MKKVLKQNHYKSKLKTASAKVCSAKDHRDFNEIPLSITDDRSLCSAGSFVDDKTSIRQTASLVSVTLE